MNDLAELLTRSCVTEGCTCHEAALVRAIRELIAERDAFYAASVGIQEGTPIELLGEFQRLVKERAEWRVPVLKTSPEAEAMVAELMCKNTQRPTTRRVLVAATGTASAEIRAAERERIATLAMAQSDALYRTCDHDSQPDGWYVLQDFAETIRALGDK